MHDSRKKYFCDHCNALVSKTLYFKHKKLFYDSHLKIWKSKRIAPTTEEEFVLNDDPVEEAEELLTYEGSDTGSH